MLLILRKDHDPTLFNDLVVELARRNKPVDYETLGRGERVERRVRAVREKVQRVTAGGLLRLYGLELMLLVGVALVAWW